MIRKFATSLLIVLGVWQLGSLLAIATTRRPLESHVAVAAPTEEGVAATEPPPPPPPPPPAVISADVLSRIGFTCPDGRIILAVREMAGAGVASALGPLVGGNAACLSLSFRGSGPAGRCLYPNSQQAWNTCCQSPVCAGGSVNREGLQVTLKTAHVWATVPASSEHLTKRLRLCKELSTQFTVLAAQTWAELRCGQYSDGPLLPASGSSVPRLLAIDVGLATGEDSVLLLRRGYDVVAVEGTSALPLRYRSLIPPPPQLTRA